MRPLSLYALILILILASQSIAQDESKQKATQEKKKQVPTALNMDVDGTKIKIPLPADLVPLKSELKTMAKFINAKAPTNQLHEIFAAKGTTEKLFLEKGIKRNADVQTVKALHNKVTDEIYDQIKKVITKQFDKIVKDAAKQLSEDELKIDTFKKVGTGIFYDKGNGYSYLFYFSIKAGDKTVQRVSAANVCFIKDNLVMLNVHSDLESEKDAEWVKKTARQWVEATLKEPVNKEN